MAQKKLKRRARRLPAPVSTELTVPREATVVARRGSQRKSSLRQLAAIDFVADPDSNSVDWHWKRSDRDYRRVVPHRTFRSWSLLDKWAERRGAFWADVEARVLSQWRERIVAQRFREIEELTQVRTHLAGYLRPLQKNGKILLDAKTGLPRFALKLPPFHQFVRMFLELDSQLMQKRGEATTRADESLKQKQDRAGETVDPAAANAPLNKEDVRALSRVLLRMHQPGLEEALSNLDLDGLAGDDPSDGESDAGTGAGKGRKDG
jgi:hypothetical protein